MPGTGQSASTGFSVDLERLEAVADVDLRFLIDATAAAGAKLRDVHGDTDDAFRGTQYRGGNRYGDEFTETDLLLETTIRKLHDNVTTAAEAVREIARRYRSADLGSAQQVAVIGKGA